MPSWLRWGLAALAAVNLIVLLLFADRLFPVGGEPLPDGENTGRTPSAEILFDDRILTYNGSTPFTAMTGVTAKDRDGTDLTQYVSVSVEPMRDTGTRTYCRTLIYSVRSRNGVTAKAERSLVLENYHFPSISFTGAGTAIKEEELPDAARMFAENGMLTADDGFGHDITGSVHISCDVPITSSGNYTVKLTAENFLGDTAEVRSSLYVDAGTPLITLRLTTAMVTLPVGADFHPEAFIEAAFSPTSGDLTPLVYVEGTVDTQKPGTYQLTYHLTDYSGNAAAPVSLIVNIVE